MMNPDFDIAVLGAGIVGCSAAIAMARRGYRVALIDEREMEGDLLGDSSRVYALNQASQNLLDYLGISAWIDRRAVSFYQKMKVWDERSQAMLDLDSSMIARPSLGMICPESVLKMAVWKTIKNLPIKLFPLTPIQRIDESSEQISLECGERLSARFLILADGAQSKTRDLLAVPLTTWSYAQSAIVARVRTEKSHQFTAYQVFHSEGPLAFLPLSSVHECSIVWSNSLEEADVLMGLSHEAFTERLNRAFGSELGQSQLLSQPKIHPLVMRHVNRYVGKRWLLMGDVAHTIHPLAGLGLNLGLADLDTWMYYSNQVNLARWTSKLLLAYQRSRKHSVWKVIAMMELFHQGFRGQSSLASSCRQLGFQFINQFDFIKRMMIHEASGLGKII